MAKHTPSDSASPSSTWKRTVLIAVVLVVAAGAAVLVFLPSIRFSLRIGELHAADPQVRSHAFRKLVEDTDPATLERLRDTFYDGSVSFSVRRQVGEILIAKNREQLVYDAVKANDLDVRSAALTVMHGQSRYHGLEWFTRTFLDDPSYDTRGTLKAWLEREGDLTRGDALYIALDFQMPELLPVVRPLVRLPREGNLSEGERRIVIRAGQVIVRYGDCETVPALVEPARSAADDVVRLRSMQSLYNATVGAPGTCKDTVPEETVRDIVYDALASAGPTTIQGGLLILTQHPAWVSGVSERLYDILEGRTGDSEFVRRHALAALAAAGGEAFLRRLPAYFHSEEQYIRSSAMTNSTNPPKDAPVRYESCWIGMLGRETENEHSFKAARRVLRDRAGREIGLPEGLPRSGQARKDAVQRFGEEMWSRGESGGLSRLAWTEAWFRWWAGEVGLEGDAVEDAVRVRAEFWQAAQAGDVEEARGAIEDFAEAHPDLFVYEQGWLTKNGA